MPYYQLNYLVSSELTEEEAKRTAEEIVSFLRDKNKAIIVKSESPIKRDLAYPVNDQKQAYLVSLDLRTDSSKLDDLRKGLKENDNVLRFILHSQKPERKRISTTRRRFKTKPAEVKITDRATSIEKAEKKTKEEEKEKLEEIEKKLDEILGE